MSTVNATVTRGYTFPLDSDNKTDVTPDHLNQAALPTVQLSLVDSVDTEDIKEDAVGTTEIDNTLADLIRQIDVAVGAEAADNIDVTFTVQDAKGETLADNNLIRLWLTNSTSTLDPNVTTFPDGGAAVQGDGVEITATADDTIGVYITPATGIIVIRFNHTAGALSGLYPVAEMGGKLYVGSELEWAA